jgi:hypothetical protein
MVSDGLLAVEGRRIRVLDQRRFSAILEGGDAE